MENTVKGKAIDWLFNQGPAVVLLVAILAFLLYTVTYITPEHLKMIQSGYERIEDKHAVQHAQLIESFEKSTSRQIEIIDTILKRNGIAFEEVIVSEN